MEAEQCLRVTVLIPKAPPHARPRPYAVTAMRIASVEQRNGSAMAQPPSSMSGHFPRLAEAHSPSIVSQSPGPHVVPCATAEWGARQSGNVILLGSGSCL